MFDVVCVGNIVADVIVRTVDELPPTGTLVYKDSISLYSGGCAMSSSVDMAILGIKSAIIAKIGNDSFGEFLKGVLVKNNVDTKGLIVSESLTSASVALIDSNSERTFLHCPGANAFFTEDDVYANWDTIEAGKVVFAAGMMIMPSFDGQPCANVLKKCQEAGKITALDTAWDSTGEWMKKLEPCMPYIDYFLPSFEEAEKLSGESDVKKIADIFFDMGVKHVVIKLGKNGCYLRENKGSEGIYLPTYSNVKPVCTTGAGDSFCAGFLFGLLNDYPLIKCAEIGNAVGSHCVMETGATAGIVPFAQIEKFMIENREFLR